MYINMKFVEELLVTFALTVLCSKAAAAEEGCELELTIIASFLGGIVVSIGVMVGIFFVKRVFSRGKFEISESKKNINGNDPTQNGAPSNNIDLQLENDAYENHNLQDDTRTTYTDLNLRDHTGSVYTDLHLQNETRTGYSDIRLRDDNPSGYTELNLNEKK